MCYLYLNMAIISSNEFPAHTTRRKLKVVEMLANYFIKDISSAYFSDLDLSFKIHIQGMFMEIVNKSKTFGYRGVE